ncbi:hypothetical protein J4Q44_G00266260 [Coregonus suidteri]|uniref:Retinoic acid receptor responder protein 2 n=1 Tax=Coregonus suidteri TaxID=861788 RepID=A0AAN8QKM2_9TELE
MKMNGLLCVLLATSAALLFTAKGQENYDMLRELDKKHVDMAIRYANKNDELQKSIAKNEHLNFFKVNDQSEVKGQEFRINLLLKATVCPKASSESEHKHRHDCGFKPNRPYINCVVCNKNFHDSTDPYIDCVRNKDVKTRDVIRHDKCSTLLHGAETISSFNRDVLAVSDN